MRPTEEQLNAYVDGELPPDEHALVAESIARDRELAACVATLSRLKSSLATLAEAPPQPIHVPARRWLPKVAGIAASLVLSIAAIMLLAQVTRTPESDAEAWYGRADEAHARWISLPFAAGGREIDANLYLTSIDRINLPVHAPDLSSARLRLTYLRFHEATYNRPAALHLGYTGRHGCRLTLWVSPSPTGLDSALVEMRTGKTRRFSWRSGEAGYVLLATGMAEARFTMIANKVFEATRNLRGFDQETRLALDGVTRAAPPCAA